MRPSQLDMRGMLAFLALWLLSQKPSSGRELAEEMGRRRGVRPNPGSIYPALKALRRKGLVRGEREGRSIVYTLTDRGRKELGLARKHFKRVFGDI